MAVLTTDTLLQGIRRDDVYAWLGDLANHDGILKDAFDATEKLGPGQFDLTMTAPLKSRVLGYRFKDLDDSHGGRRVYIETTGKHTTGTMSYSLRTMKPSTNTLVTLHIDYDPGGPVGEFVNKTFIADRLQKAMVTMLENLSRNIPRDA